MTPLTEWLDEIENFSLRRERVPDGAMPWIEEAYRLGFAAAVEEVKRLTMSNAAIENSCTNLWHRLKDSDAENERLAKLVWGERAKLADENEKLRERVTEAENRQGLAEIERDKLKEELAKIGDAVSLVIDDKDCTVEGFCKAIGEYQRDSMERDKLVEERERCAKIVDMRLMGHPLGPIITAAIRAEPTPDPRSTQQSPDDSKPSHSES